MVSFGFLLLFLRLPGYRLSDRLTKEVIMCCYNYFENPTKIISKAILDATFRKRFLANPMATAREFGLTEAEQKELALYDARKLRAIVEGPV
jgi:hypothetical protein